MGIFEYACMNKVRFTSPKKGGTMMAEETVTVHKL